VVVDNREISVFAGTLLSRTERESQRCLAIEGEPFKSPTVSKLLVSILIEIPYYDVSKRLPRFDARPDLPESAARQYGIFEVSMKHVRVVEFLEFPFRRFPA
jgi:hypothetical protein